MSRILCALTLLSLSGCVVFDFKRHEVYKPSTHALIEQCNGSTHTRRIMTQNSINEDYMMADCPPIPPYHPAERLDGR